MALGCMYLSISPELQYHVEHESLLTPNELWTKLEFIFRNKEDCEDFMEEIDKIELAENSLEEQASQFGATSTS